MLKGRAGWDAVHGGRELIYQIELRYGKEVRIIRVKDENYDYPACLHQLDTSWSHQGRSFS